MSNNIIIKKNFYNIKEDKERKYNPTASKIFTINLVLKCIGYLFSFVTFVINAKTSFTFGLLYFLGSALTVFIISTFADGFAEIIQLLEDIKNKKYTEEK